MASQLVTQKTGELITADGESVDVRYSVQSEQVTTPSWNAYCKDVNELVSAVLLGYKVYPVAMHNFRPPSCGGVCRDCGCTRAEFEFSHRKLRCQKKT